MFLSPEESATRYITELNNFGINKIVILSHLGYEHDVTLAKTVPGIDIIVGGHTATFMGGPEFEQIGLKPEMPYPIEVAGPDGGKVLIVHAWEYNRLLGQIDWTSMIKASSQDIKDSPLSSLPMDSR